MFARNISVHLKPNMLAEFNQTYAKDVIPMLRKQKGFHDAMTLATGSVNDVITISLWDTKADAEAYNTAGYPEVLKVLAKSIDGAPKVRTSEVLFSTAHKIGATPVAA